MRVKATLSAWITSEYTNTSLWPQMSPKDIIGQMSFYSQDMSGHGWIRVGQAHIVFEAEDNDFTLQTINMFEIKKAKLLAETQLKINEIDQKIQELRALPAL